MKGNVWASLHGDKDADGDQEEEVEWEEDKNEWGHGETVHGVTCLVIHQLLIIKSIFPNKIENHTTNLSFSQTQ